LKTHLSISVVPSFTVLDRSRKLHEIQLKEITANLQMLQATQMAMMEKMNNAHSFYDEALRYSELPEYLYAREDSFVPTNSEEAASFVKELRNRNNLKLSDSN